MMSKGADGCMVGPAAFGPAYRFLLEHDCHAAGSVDCEIVKSLVRLTPGSVDRLYHDFTPLRISYRVGTRPVLEAVVQKLQADGGHQFVVRLAEFGAEMSRRAPQQLDDMVFGGTEEEIIARGSDWCTDVARVICTLAQVARVPARLVNLFDLEHAYSGHVIVELFHRDAWGALDALNGAVYRQPNGAPASVWTLMQTPALVTAHGQSAAQFGAAGIANYFVWDSDRFDYTTSRLNDYCRSILEQAERGWPGGLRWLHGEDKLVE